MSFFPSLTPPPPPFLSTANGGMSETSKPYNDNSINNAGLNTSTSSSSSSTSVTSSIVITSIVISSAIIISASIYILLRFLSRRSDFTSADDVVLHNHMNRSSTASPSHRHSDSYYHTALNSLPVFTFGSLNGNLTEGDCAVCLSKFEREEQLRLLPLCCHAFHTQCIDAWLLSNQTCPLCRSTVYPTDTDLLNKNLGVNDENMNENNISSNGSSFRVEIGNISSRGRGILHEGIEGEGARSYSLGSFEYIVDEGYEIPMDSTYVSGGLDVGLVDKETNSGMEAPAGGSGGSWLRDYVDRLSSRAMSFRSSGRFFSGSSRRNDVVVPLDEDLEDINNHAGEDISELFRWISGV